MDNETDFQTVLQAMDVSQLTQTMCAPIFVHDLQKSVNLLSITKYTFYCLFRHLQASRNGPSNTLIPILLKLPYLI